MKILYVTTISSTIEFLIQHIKLLVEQGHQVDVAFNIIKEIPADLLELDCKVYDLDFQRSPVKRENYKAYKDIKKIVTENNYDLVHTHTPIASAIVRLACRNIKKTKVYYTAHGFHFYKRAPLMNWILYYPIERWLARYTDVIITINKEDYERAKTFSAKSIEYIPGVGLNIDKFRYRGTNRMLGKEAIGVPKDAFIVLSAGEINKNKNHKVIISAIDKLNNPNIHYLICGNGPLKDSLIKLTQKLKLDNQVHLLGFRNDMTDIYEISDAFVFPSLREGLGMAALEAMASGLPIITSNIHGIVDYSIDGKTGYTLKPTDINGFSEAIDKLYKDKELRISMGEYNKKVVKKYSLNNALMKIEHIYQKNI